MALYPTKPRTLVASNAVDYGFRYADTVKRHHLGHFIDMEDGRRFRYVYVGTGGLQAEFGCCFGYKSIVNAVAPTQVTGAGVVGSSKVCVTIGASEEPASGAFSVNDPFLVGGYVVIGNGTSQHPQNRRIIGNTSLTNAGGTITLTLDEPLDIAVTASTTNIEGMFNRYAWATSGNVTNSSYVTFIGMPAVTCDAGTYAWVQTRGPVWITSDGNTCNSAGDRRIYFVANGSVVSGDDVTSDINLLQMAGYAIDASGSAASNAPFVYLQME
ncbi:MAG: hypothetical protein IMZ62_10470 [Chloroflexi bacterium]|nr:hypothetical protein [Chloroflexota bacterium]MBE3117893.1 hypothetical protein [Candidatus Atribacteria bacterium]